MTPAASLSRLRDCHHRQRGPDPPAEGHADLRRRDTENWASAKTVLNPRLLHRDTGDSGILREMQRIPLR
jgi:hypothetical protein